MNICVYGASSDQIDRGYLDAAFELGVCMARAGHTLIFGGGATGLMGASARGMAQEGGTIVGIAPSFFDRPGVLYPHCTEFVFTETMRERKQLMEDRSDAFIMTPGGIGTFEEFFEILTLRQLRRHHKPIGILNVNGYYDPLITLMEQAIAQQFMHPACRELYIVHDDPATLLRALCEATEAYDASVPEPVIR